MKTVEIIFYSTLVLGLIVIVCLCLSKSNYNGPAPASQRLLLPGPSSGPAPKNRGSSAPHHNKTHSSNWCNDLGGTMKNDECVFSSWDSCVKSLDCETDPSVVHPGWYNADESKNYEDVAQSMLNGEMDIVDICAPANTSWNSNPRCKIKNGEYSGKTGVCVYDGVNVNSCNAVGQGCKAKIDEFCPGLYGDPFTGKIKKQHLMCRQVKQTNGDNKVTAVCAY
tara:strand:- start:1322 stop:1990 length:669 start_codon:yes stop_codon:yes gene_type:complete